VSLFAHQAYLLNKIEIGQFLYMKYKVGIKNNINVNIMEEISLFTWSKHLSIIKPVTIITAIVRMIIAPKCLGCLPTKLWPSLFKNTLLPINSTSEQPLTTKETKIRVIQKNTPPKIVLLSPKYHAAESPLLIPTQNIMFQKLSLFSRDLIKLIISLVHILKYKTIFSIVSRFRVWRKTISLSIVILIASFSTHSCFADTIAELIDKTEAKYAIPSGLLSTISNVESGNKPYALNISGKPIFANSKEEAVKIVRGCQDSGITNIDLSLAQINLHWHGENFKSIEEMLEPKHNIEYAAKFLSKLYRQHGSWSKAVRRYHTANPQYHIKYSHKVLISWLGA
jgi:Transglycosylase SLT domain